MKRRGKPHDPPDLACGKVVLESQFEEQLVERLETAKRIGQGPVQVSRPKFRLRGRGGGICQAGSIELLRQEFDELTSNRARLWTPRPWGRLAPVAMPEVVHA